MIKKDLFKDKQEEFFKYLHEIFDEAIEKISNKQEEESVSVYFDDVAQVAVIQNEYFEIAITYDKLKRLIYMFENGETENPPKTHLL